MKKQMKKALSLILAVFMALTVLPTSAFAQTQGEGTLYWGVAGSDFIISSNESDTDGCTDRGSFSGNEEWTAEERPWDSHSRNIGKVSVKGTVAPTSTCNWFSNFNNCSSIDLSGLDASNVTNMSFMFSGWNGSTTLDLSGLDTSSVTNMSGMFLGSTRLTALDLSGFDTSSVTNMSGMFSYCIQLASLDLSSFHTANVTDMSNMFGFCPGLKALDLSSFDTSNVTTMQEMFYHCVGLKTLDLSSFDTANVTNMSGIFKECLKLTSLDLSSFDTSKVTAMQEMFYQCNDIPALDLSAFDTANVTNMNKMFFACRYLTDLTLSSFDTANVTDMSRMFQDCVRLPALDLSHFDTANVIDMSYMFDNCGELTALNLSGFDTAKVTNMSNMFDLCSKLEAADVSSFDTANVTDMSDLFSFCKKLTAIDVSGFDTAKVTDMSNMFSWCEGLTALDLSSFDMDSVTNAAGMLSYTAKQTLTISASVADKMNHTNLSMNNTLYFLENGCGSTPTEFAYHYIDGTNGHYSGLTAGIYYMDEEYIPKEHRYSESWERDESGHRHVCANCGESKDEGPHSYTVHPLRCDICGYIRPKLPQTAPVSGEGYAIHYSDATITVESGYEVSDAKDGSGTMIASGAAVTPGTTLYIRKAADDTHTPSEWAALPVPPRPNPPEGAEAVNETVSGKKDGKLVGVSDAMEYKLDTAERWTDCGGTEVGNLAPGTYCVRVKATSSSFCSAEVTLVIAAGMAVEDTPPSGSGSSNVSHSEAAVPPVEDDHNTESIPSWTNIADVKSDAWYYDSVKQVYEMGLFYGTSDSTFSPQGTMTRGMLVTVLHRLAGTPETIATDRFSDVTAEKYYAQAVAWAAQNGIALGYGNGSFGADENITREQVAVMLYKYAGNPETTGTLDNFTDAEQASEFAHTALCWAVEQGIINGKGGGILDPKGTATRAEVAAMLVKYLAGEK